MSSTFKAHNHEIGKAYDMIWHSLPYDVKSVISPQSLFSLGMGLTKKGEALKKGLDYLNALK
jgi:hypothetical protein